IGQLRLVSEMQPSSSNTKAPIPIPTGAVHLRSRAPALSRSGQRAIVRLDVFAHHAVGGEVRRQLRHARPDHASPLLRHATLVAVIEGRDDLVLKEVIDLLGLVTIPFGVAAVLLPVADRPAEAALVGLGPP